MMKYKLQRPTNKFAIIFTGAKTNKFEVIYNMGSAWSRSPLLDDDNDDAFVNEINRLVYDALENGHLSSSANDYRQDPETELFVNIVIRAYITMIDTEATAEVTEM